MAPRQRLLRRCDRPPLGANLAGADLSSMFIDGTDLSGADLSGANLDQTYFQGSTSPA
ncbi:MAG: pentapeptide repeat-containing protein [Acidimicrobiales bacterium]